MITATKPKQKRARATKAAAPEERRIGRPPKAPDERRSGRLQKRVYPDVAEKAARLDTDLIEEAIRNIPDKFMRPLPKPKPKGSK